MSDTEDLLNQVGRISTSDIKKQTPSWGCWPLASEQNCSPEVN